MDSRLSGVSIQTVERQMIKQYVKQLERLLYKEEATSTEVVEINDRHLASFKSGEARAKAGSAARSGLMMRRPHAFIPPGPSRSHPVPACPDCASLT
jgi:hypothetical protein